VTNNRDSMSIGAGVSLENNVRSPVDGKAVILG